MQLIHHILDSRGIRTHFQPILSAKQRAIVGLEALARGGAAVEAFPLGGLDGEGQLIPPLKLFQMAHKEGVADKLELLCRETAARSFAALPNRPKGLVLFLNFELSMAVDQDTADQLALFLESIDLSPQNVAIEILESRVQSFPALWKALSRFRDLGFMIVLDDVGAGHSNLDRIPLIHPDIIKIDRSLISGVDSDYYKQETVKSLIGLSRRTGALVVAEGVETEAEAIVALELGADLLQGYFLSHPKDLAGFSDAAMADATIRTHLLAKKFKSHMVSKINQRKLHHRRFNVILNQILCELTNAEAEDFDFLLNENIALYPNVECVYVLNEAGVQVTETICNPHIPRRLGGVMFHPAPKGADHSLKEYYYILMDVELQKFTTDPYVSLATGNVCRTISTAFRDAANNRMYVLCVDVKGAEDGKIIHPGASSWPLVLPDQPPSAPTRSDNDLVLQR